MVGPVSYFQESGVGGLLGSLIPSGGLLSLAVYMGIGVAIMGAIAFLFFMIIRNKKKWFLEVEFKIPRADGKIINSEWGKGTYDAKKGVVLVKRPGKKQAAIKPFDVKKFLQGGGKKETLTVVQVGIEDYRPVLIESYLEMQDSETGAEAALMDIKIDTTESKAWKESFEREAKQAYSIQSFLQQYAQYIGFSILFFMIFIGFSILWSRVGN